MTQTLLDVAQEHQRARAALADTAAARAVRAFRRIQATELDAGWAVQEQGIVAVVTAAQVTAARQSVPYTNKVSALSGADVERSGVIAESFGGVTREGREVGPELYSSVALTKRMVGQGFGVGRAFEAGAALMSILAANLVQDMGRAADATVATATGYKYSVRVISAGACSRCAILAGVKGYRVSFERHPRCKCSSVPLMDSDDAPKGFHRSPEEYFESLSKAEQDRVFTKAGAEAIREGADPLKVVNARRGAAGIGYSSNPLYPHRIQVGRMQKTVIGRSADGSPVFGYSTIEGTTKRGSYGASSLRSGDQFVKTTGRVTRTQRIRLMPETIISLTDDPAMRRLLLRDAGYIPYQASDWSTNAWIAERAAQEAADRAAAAAFYKTVF